MLNWYSLKTEINPQTHEAMSDEFHLIPGDEMPTVFFRIWDKYSKVLKRNEFLEKEIVLTKKNMPLQNWD